MTSKAIEQSTLEDVVGQLIADQAIIALLLAVLGDQVENVRFDSLKKIMDKSDSVVIRQAFLDRVGFYQELVESRNG